ncbi:T9SS type A sorting domain-containing protein [Patescibacteria group bacterium]|nr:T9SS type A sorting domain-containing protein [Patescibacteria group bacterium]
MRKIIFFLVCLSIFTFPCLGNAQNNLSIYPNPPGNSNVINVISHYEIITEINIYNAIGNKVYTERVYAKEVTINIVNFTSGVYFIEVYSGNNNTKSKQFIKQ